MSDIVHYRAVPALLEQRNARQLIGRLVPYDTVTWVLDKGPDGKPEVYQEGFRRGAFNGQVSNGATNRKVFTKVGLIHRHEGGLGYLGPFVSLREESDGLWGEVNVVPTKAEDVGALLGDGVDELSIEFRLRAEPNTQVLDGVRWRTSAHLDQVALEPKGAYSTAQVLAYRSEVEDDERAEAEARQRAEADDEAAQRQAEAERVALEAVEVERARRVRWNELTNRIDAQQTRQRELVEQYGVTRPGGFRHA